MIYEQNLEKMQYFQNALYNNICDSDFMWDENRAELEYARNGEPVVAYIREDGTKVYLNSKYNPSKEAEKFMGDFISAYRQAQTLTLTQERNREV